MSDIWSDITPAQNILSISSHVVHGSVGNDAMQFPLNLRNWNVDCIYTTDLSAHPGHGSFTGGKVDAQLVKDLFEGIRNLSLDDEYKCVIIGYVASNEILQVVWNEILTKLDDKKDMVKIMDPVMGDHGKVYVSEQIVDSYLKLLGSNEIDIDLLTPNQFEMEILSGIKIDSWESIRASLDAFFAQYTRIKNVVITSVLLDDSMYCIGASQGKIFYYQVDQVEAVFSGSGDLFLGILTDEYVKSDQNLVTALCKTINVVSKVLQLSYQLLKNDPKLKKTPTGKLYIPDLRLIESKHILSTRADNNNNNNIIINPIYLN